MQLFTQPPELTTALTDLAASVAALVCLLRMRRVPEARAGRKRAWQGIFLLLSVSGAAGFAVHGFAIPRAAVAAAWMPLSLLLCMTAGLFAAACAYEYTGGQRFSRTLCLSAAACAMAYAAMVIVSRFYRGYFILFTAYAGACVLVSAALLLLALARQKKRWCAFFLLAAALQIAGGLIQAARTLVITVIWPFDYNSVYHFCLIASIPLFAQGYRRGAEAENGKEMLYGTGD